MARPVMNFVFRAVDPTPTPAGRILEAAHMRNTTGIGWDSPRRFPLRAVVVLINGTGQFSDSRGFVSGVRAGDVLLIHPRVGHTYGAGEGKCWEEWYVTFEGPIFDALEQCGVLDMDRPVWRLGDSSQFPARLKAIFPASGRPVNAADQVGALTAWLLSASSQSLLLAMPEARREKAWLSLAKQKLATPGDALGNMARVARECGLGYESFRKQFVALTGESPARFRRRRLISRAQTLMRERDLPDRAIADALGFCDEFHFSKTFKQITGKSPRQWRMGS